VDISFLHKHISFLNWDLSEIWVIEILLKYGSFYMWEIVYIIFTIQAVVYVSLLLRILFVNTFTSVTCQSWLMSWAQQFWLRHCLWQYPVLVTSVCHKHFSHSANYITLQSLSICNLTSFVFICNVCLL
jgi:hypothetical protein